MLGAGTLGSDFRTGSGQLRDNLLRGARPSIHCIGRRHSRHSFGVLLLPFDKTCLELVLPLGGGLTVRLAKVGRAHDDAFPVAGQNEETGGLCLIERSSLTIEGVEVLCSGHGELLGLAFGHWSSRL